MPLAATDISPLSLHDALPICPRSLHRLRPLRPARHHALELHELDEQVAALGDVGRLQQSLLGADIERRNLGDGDRKSTRLNSSHLVISYAVFCLKKKKHKCPS